MIATLSGQRGHIDESISTCRFAARVAMVKNTAWVNEEIDPKLVIKKLKLQVKELREELKALRGEKFLNKTLDPDELEACQQLVREYMQQTSPQITYSLSHPAKVQACFEQFKQLVHSNSNSGQQSSVQPSGSGHHAADPNELKRWQTLVDSRDHEISLLISLLRQGHRNTGDLDKMLSDIHTRAETAARYGAAVAPATTSAYQTVDPVKQQQLMSKQLEKLKDIHDEYGPDKTGLSIQEDEQLLQQRALMFEEFRKSYKKNQMMEEQKDNLKSKIAEAQYLGESINRSRLSINQLKSSIEQRRIQRGVSQLTDQGPGQ